LETLKGKKQTKRPSVLYPLLSINRKRKKIAIYQSCRGVTI